MKKKEIRFFVSCNRSLDDLDKFFMEMPEQSKVFLTYYNKVSDSYVSLAKNYKQVELLDLAYYDLNIDANEVSSKVVGALNKIYFDISTPLIYERKTTSVIQSLKDLLIGTRPSYLKGTAIISRHAMVAFRLLRDTKPSFLFYPSTPHTIGSWVQFKVAQELGIPCFILRRCAIPGFYRMFVTSGDDTKLIDVGAPSNDESEHHGNVLKDYCQRVGGSYADVQPEYEKTRFSRNRGKYISHKYLIRKNWYSPNRYFNTLICWKHLNKLSKPLSYFKNERFAVLFLHYQPERTTVPDGGLFGAQLNAIMSLRSTLPDNVTLLVKEHPSTFTNYCSTLARDAEFYKIIASISGVEWVDIKDDNFEIIDSALMTATITGTVGLESLLRGAPVVFFGQSFIEDCYGCLNFSEGYGLEQFVNSVMDGEFNKASVMKAAEETVLSEVLNSFYCPSPSEDAKKNKALMKILKLPQLDSLVL